MVAVALGGSLLVSYTRARGESQGVVCKVGVMQRAERLLLLGFAGFLDPSLAQWLDVAPGTLLTWVISLIALGTIGTAIYRTVWIAKRLSSTESPELRPPSMWGRGTGSTIPDQLCATSLLFIRHLGSERPRKRAAP